MTKSQFMTNLEVVGEMIGNLKGLAEGLNEERYVEDLLKDAHGVASNSFDMAAAATGATGRLAHVFEYGTAGITPGPVKFANPTDQAARLYVHKIAGRGGTQDISYTFRPALNRNPQPTTKSTGVPSKYLRRLSKRKYVFWNKAFVMETGQPVEIQSQRGTRGLLFVPTPGANAPRNFIMFPSKTNGPITAVPGQQTKGSFTAFWMGWWASQGQDIVEADMARRVTEDVEKAERHLASTTNKMVLKPAAANNITTSMEKGKTASLRMFRRNSK